MNIWITGAAGFVGSRLVRLLLEEGAVDFAHLLLLDRRSDQIYADPRVEAMRGDFFDRELLAAASAYPPDWVFHLASIPGALAEREFALGQRVNLEGTLALLEALRSFRRSPVVVFASSVAVYGSPLPPLVDDQTPASPSSSYGTQKRIGELLLQDYTRRGYLDGRALRLPGIVARPPGPSGLASAFMSELLRHLEAGIPYTLPVSPQAAMWWMSARCAAENLLHAARLPLASQEPRIFLLPALWASVEEVVAEGARLFGNDRKEMVRYQPDPELEARFGRYPPLEAKRALAQGFHHDESLTNMMVRALEDFSKALRQDR
ncbi:MULTISPECIES: NAD-dependent epimerase/dehydratase family protein [unclassified Meiothermus]|uniref:NAD-dependent epimerase/dehydratase family protein n=1 Tax=unclassified Meiothermus TaxID=370471 RepID=UPI000D7C758C|nr:MULTISPECIES: NAD-dependent epimerase/dehydratase family protein [unclassified Meiothermus]PZA07704.1 epimerase [Meiothermus sp. Pnk-1]RYM34483.1 NAD-dependent epimerase/dehydratase family protein [Meiothermus sp. PNK-Is4]